MLKVVSLLEDLETPRNQPRENEYVDMEMDQPGQHLGAFAAATGIKCIKYPNLTALNSLIKQRDITADIA